MFTAPASHTGSPSWQTSSVRERYSGGTVLPMALIGLPNSVTAAMRGATAPAR